MSRMNAASRSGAAMTMVMRMLVGERGRRRCVVRM